MAETRSEGMDEIGGLDLEPEVAARVAALMAGIQAQSVRVGVIGLGYVGLPFAVEKGKVGFSVLGFDRQQARVDRVNQGRNYIGDVADAELAALVAAGRLRATTDMAQLADMDVLVIAVPTPLNKNLNPDLRHIEAVIRATRRA